MNWIAKLYELYEKNKSQAGVQKGDGTLLLPLYHTTVAAQITVEIDGEGNFLGAEPVAEEDKLTLIPVTEESASRTANPTPHPLCDNLEYLAGDYESYAAGKNAEKSMRCTWRSWAGGSILRSAIPRRRRFIDIFRKIR